LFYQRLLKTYYKESLYSTSAYLSIFLLLKVILSCLFKVYAMLQSFLRSQLNLIQLQNLNYQQLSE